MGEMTCSEGMRRRNEDIKDGKMLSEQEGIVRSTMKSAKDNGVRWQLR